MSRTLALLFTFIALAPADGRAQSADPPRWDFAVTTGLFEGQPEPASPATVYGDDWYGAARAGLSVGYYWTAHLKTEAEVMTSGEGRRYTQRFATLADGSTWPYGSEEYFRVSQGSARVVWQLLDNRWIHPYVLAGVSLDHERQRSVVAEQYRYFSSTPTTPALRELLVRDQTSGPNTVYRAGAVLGGGAKLYMAANVFANTALLVTYARPAKSVSLVLGIGGDF